MKDEPVPPQDNISRYCGGSHIQDGEIDGTAFCLRKGYDKFLSANWLEFLRLFERHEEIREIRRVLAAKMKLGSTAMIAVCNVGDLLRHVEAATHLACRDLWLLLRGRSDRGLIAEVFNDAGEKYSAIDHRDN